MKPITCETESEKKMKINLKAVVEWVEHDGEHYQRQSGATWYKVVGDAMESVYGAESQRLEDAYKQAKFDTGVTP